MYRDLLYIDIKSVLNSRGSCRLPKGGFTSRCRYSISQVCEMSISPTDDVIGEKYSFPLNAKSSVWETTTAPVIQYTLVKR